MSDILIKNMEMPKDKAVAVVIHPDGTAYTAEMFAGVCTEYLSDCTAVPVCPHGRLIDQDAILRQVIRGDYPNQWIDKDELLRLFRNAPTVIPASEEVET